METLDRTASRSGDPGAHPDAGAATATVNIHRDLTTAKDSNDRTAVKLTA
jgi:hypothetical protein